VVRQRTPVDEHAAQLVHPALPCIHSNGLQCVTYGKTDTGRQRRIKYSLFLKNNLVMGMPSSYVSDSSSEQDAALNTNENKFLSYNVSSANLRKCSSHRP
jgi:hypothetical protein